MCHYQISVWAIKSNDFVQLVCIYLVKKLLWRVGVPTNGIFLKFLWNGTMRGGICEVWFDIKINIIWDATIIGMSKVWIDIC